MPAVLLAANVSGVTRRAFVKGAVAAGTATVPRVLSAPTGPAEAIAGVSYPVEDWWLGPELWANRLQDWAMRNGRITCVAASERQLRTASVLTRPLNGGPAQLQVNTGTEIAGNGFSGFLVGTGEAGTDYRRAALVLSASGTGGGLLCVYSSDGSVQFRRHTDEVTQFDYPVIPASTSGPEPPRAVGERVRLTLDVAAQSTGVLASGVTATATGDQSPDSVSPTALVSLTLRAVEIGTGTVLSQAVLLNVPASSVTGGLALVSSGSPSPAATYWLSNLRTAGLGVEWHPERTFGPVVGTLFTQTGSTLKMTVQLVPMLLQTDDVVTLKVFDDVAGSWVRRTVAPVGPGFTSTLRVDDWDATRGWDYRVVFSRGGSWSGHVPAEPSTDHLTIATLCCTKAAHRQLDRATSGVPRLPGEETLGLYTSANVWFPYEELASNIAAQHPDMLVALGDQFYETSPTVKDGDLAPELDFLYKYLMWLWSFRELTRRIPCVVAIDDHDVYQGNLWGDGGVARPAGAAFAAGGYVNSAEWVNTVQRVQCWHDPDPVDPAPVAQGITVYFTTFAYGGVRFALLEDRKFKTGGDGRDDAGALLPPSSLVLLGERQEALLRSFRDDGSSAPAVVLTQTLFGSLVTTADGSPGSGRDSNGWPPLGRKRALRLVKSAGAVMLGGDTHLASFVRHGIDATEDGPVQFTAPAGAASFQRWFEPAATLANATGQPHTGDLVDGFGNAMRVLAVKNMQWTQAEVTAAYGDSMYGHRDFKEEGYGLLRVDLAKRVHVFESWRWDVDPTALRARPMGGWPQTVAFADA